MFKGSHILEQQFNFLENGAYRVKVRYEPVNFGIKILNRFGVLKTETPIIEIGADDKWQFVGVEKSQELVARGAFLTRSGIKTVRVKFKKFTIMNFYAIVTLEKLPN